MISFAETCCFPEKRNDVVWSKQFFFNWIYLSNWNRPIQPYIKLKLHGTMHYSAALFAFTLVRYALRKTAFMLFCFSFLSDYVLKTCSCGYFLCGTYSFGQDWVVLLPLTKSLKTTSPTPECNELFLSLCRWSVVHACSVWFLSSAWFSTHLTSRIATSDRLSEALQSATNQVLSLRDFKCFPR